MQIMQLSDLNLRRLKPLEGAPNIMVDKKRLRAFKFYNFKTPHEGNILKQRLELLEQTLGPSFPHTIIQDALVFEKQKLYCSIMEYIFPQVPLDFLKIPDDFLRKILLTISQTIEKLHEQGIIFGDLHFHNVVLDAEFSPHLIDFENCSIDGLHGTHWPSIMAEFVGKTFKCTSNYMTPNFDRICLLVSIIHSLTKQNPRNLSARQLCELSEKSSILNSIRPYILELKKHGMDAEIPYLDQII